MKNATHGYRGEVGVYEVVKDMEAAFGTATANSQFGVGGGQQLFIPNYQTNLNLLYTIPLK